MTVSTLFGRLFSRSATRGSAASSAATRQHPSKQATASPAVRSRSFFSSAGPTPDPVFLPYISDALMPLILGIVLYARKDPEASPSDQLQLEGPFQVKDSGKGLGAFATEDIKRGTVLLSEMPLVVWETTTDGSSAKKLVDAMTPEARKQFLSLANALPNSDSLEPALGIRGTNGFNVQLPPVPAEMASSLPVARYAKEGSPSHVSMVYPRVARINHSCLPNADHAIDWATLQMTVYATTDIKAGSEINIEYQPALIQRSRDQRQSQLYQAFGFNCGCSACAAPPAEVAASDARRESINQLVLRIADDGAHKRRAQTTDGLKQMRALLDVEGYPAMPEFDDANVSKAFAYWASMMIAKENDS